MQMKKFLFILTCVFALCFTSCKVVDNSEIGIKFNKFAVSQEGIIEATNVSGFVFYNPIITSIYTYPTFIQRIDYEPFKVTTKDAATFTMDPVLAYQLDRSKATYVFSKYRKSLKEIEAGYMRTCIYDAYRIIANNYTSDELMASRAKFEGEVRSMLDRSLNEEGFIVNEFTSQITPPESLRKTIDEKNAAIQQSLKAINEVKKAEAEAKIAIAKAEGEAKAMRIKADAEAYYNKTISASLSNLIIQEDFIERWDGHLPQVQGGNDLMPIINFK